MKNIHKQARAAVLVSSLFCGALLASGASAQESASPLVPTEAAWEVTIAPYVYHFSSDPAHKTAYLIGLERQRADNWIIGGAYFSNSFGQDSGTAYVGYIWNNLFGVPALYGKVVAGIMYGYVYPYEDKVPFNHNGWSPIVVPALGWRFTPKDAVQVSLLGTAGLMFSYNRRF
ncbi:hypothetical protein [Variovorax sp. OV329]|uniref:hypothetical protein n=1 Tax=Variovorax sp. OV329 TaxID=1882825 RepID=UPI0008E8AD9C|nr:hypothetical protein [Variovorax sp. OV329]SFL90883.1 hypothetical protein SAMN05444747_101227 [Variovorax sp. OV329]